MNLYDIVKITTSKLANLAVTTAKLADNSVTNSKFRTSSGLSVIGTPGVPGNVQDISAQTADSVLRRDGTTLGFGQIKSGAIETGAITAPKLSGAQGGSAPIYGVRAWVVFSGAGAIGANQFIDGSGNVTSVIKNGTGEYTLTFTTPLPNADYVCVGSTGDTFGSNSSVNFITPATNTLYFKTYHSSNTLGDFVRVHIIIVG
jgi:hypothetical protein